MQARSVAFTAPQQRRSIRDGLIAWWAFDRDLRSSTPNFHLTAQGRYESADGKVGGSLALHGDGWLETTETFSVVQPFTFCAWVRLGHLGSQRPIFASDSFSLTYIPQVNEWRFLIACEDGSSAEARCGGGSTQWRFLCAVFDGILLEASINAKQPDLFGVCDRPPRTAPSLLRFGSDGNSVFDGGIDEAVLFTRALLGRDILYLYNEGRGRSYEEVQEAPEWAA